MLPPVLSSGLCNQVSNVKFSPNLFSYFACFPVFLSIILPILVITCLSSKVKRQRHSASYVTRVQLYDGIDGDFVIWSNIQNVMLRLLKSILPHPHVKDSLGQEWWIKSRKQIKTNGLDCWFVDFCFNFHPCLDNLFSLRSVAEIQPWITRT